MSNHPTPPIRLYTEKEVGEILARATETHGERPEGPSGSPAGLSLAELEGIALEAGIDPMDLRRAAVELDSGGSGASGWARITGDQLTLVREAVISGEITPTGFERVVTVVRQTAGEFGQPSVFGRTLTWQAETSSKMRTIQLVVAPKDGETHVRLEERRRPTASPSSAGSKSVCISSPELFSEALWAGWEGGWGSVPGSPWPRPWGLSCWESQSSWACSG